MNKTRLSSLAAVVVLLASSIGLAATVTAPSTKVHSVRAYITGGGHIFFESDLDGTGPCGKTLRVNSVNDDADIANIFRIALSAKLSGSNVVVQHDDVLSGAYCDIVSIRIE